MLEREQAYEPFCHPLLSVNDAVSIPNEGDELLLVAAHHFTSPTRLTALASFSTSSQYAPKCEM